MTIRNATPADLPALLTLYQNARAFMAAHGNAGQWGEHYPEAALLSSDIAQNALYLCEEAGELLAAFALYAGEDATYRVIDGAWKDDRPYATLHRIASSGKRRGMMDEIVRYAFTRYHNLRGDTHAANTPMQQAFERNGFERCGTIWVADGTPRIAYQKRA